MEPRLVTVSPFHFFNSFQFFKLKIFLLPHQQERDELAAVCVPMSLVINVINQKINKIYQNVMFIEVIVSGCYVLKVLY